MEAYESAAEPQEGFAVEVTLAEARARLELLLERAEDGPIAVLGPHGTLLGALLSPADVRYFQELEDAADHEVSQRALAEEGEQIPLERLASDLGL